MSVTEYFEELLEGLLDEDRELRPAELSELSDLNSQQVEAFRAAWGKSDVDRRREIVVMLGRMAEDQFELLFERVNRQIVEDPDPVVRRQAIANLWESEDGRFGEFLVHVIREDPDQGVREQAVQALGRFIYLGELDKISAELRQDIEEALLDVLRTEGDSSLRQAALRSLGYSSRREVPDYIRTAYRSDEDAAVRSGVIAMGRSADRDWLPQVLKVLDHPEPSIRSEAARAAGELEARRATDRLIELLQDAHPDVRRAAIWALGQVGGDDARDALIELQEAEAYEEFEQAIDEALDHIAFLESTPDLTVYDYEARRDE